MEGDEKFINRYRIDTTRLPGWNYGDDGYYFVTICTHNRELYFGDVLVDNDGAASVALMPIGKIVRDELLNTPRIRTNVRLDEWIIMPNHMHAIIIIDNSSVETAPLGRLDSDDARRLVNPVDETHRAFHETPHRGRLYNGERGFRHEWHKTEWQPNSLGSIVNQFKSVCTKQIRKINPSFAWQTRYYDRIIPARGGQAHERALYAVRYYMATNPENWERDRNNPTNLLM